MRVKVALAPSGNCSARHDTFPMPPTAGLVQVQPAGASKEAKVVRAGGTSSRTTCAAVSGPALSTLIVYVMFAPARTGSGESLMATERSGSAALVTVVVSVAVLFVGFESVVLEAISAMLVIVVSFAAAFTLTTSLKLAPVPPASVAMVQVTVPVPPNGGTVQVKVAPVFWVNETKVVPAGTASVSVTPWASLGPRLVRLMV